MLMWVMSDRALPRSFATMEGFGVHTFRLVNAEGVSRFVKFHWKPLKGVCSLVWEEATLISGKDPDFNRRDLWESIERGDFPEYELGLQIVEEKPTSTSSASICSTPPSSFPRRLVPVVPVGKLTLNRNPDNFFAETEQVAFHTGHIIPGIDFTNDPLLQGRLFSYIDTQLRRVGPNFHELPINRSVRPADNNQRDGFARMTINKGRVAYFPNSLGGGCPDAFACRCRGLPLGRGQGAGRAQGARAQPELQRSFQPGDAVLEQHERLGEGPHRRRLRLRAEPGGRRDRARPHA